MTEVAEVIGARDELRAMLPAGSRVHTVLRHVSSSGMTRWIDCLILGDDGAGECGARWISRRVAQAAGLTFDERRDCLKVGGAGMDMGFWAVYELSSALYPDGFECVGDGREACPTCGGSGKRSKARSAGYELERHERAGTVCDTCGGDGWTGRYVGPRCPSNDHANDPHGGWGAGVHHKAGGYALRQAWL